jgi:hypothetical protein
MILEFRQNSTCIIAAAKRGIPCGTHLSGFSKLIRQLFVKSAAKQLNNQGGLA